MDTPQSSSPTKPNPPAQERLVDIQNLFQKMAEADDPERTAELAEQAQRLDGAGQDYGFADLETTHSGNVDPDAIAEMMGRDAKVAANRLTEGSLPEPQKGAVQVDTYTPMASGLPYKIQEQSGPRYCAAGLYREHTGRDLRPVRLRMIFPPDGGLTPELRDHIRRQAEARQNAGRKPPTTSQRLAKAIPEFPQATGDALEAKQRGFVKAMAMAFARLGTAGGDGGDLRRQAVEHYLETGGELAGDIGDKSDPELLTRVMRSNVGLEHADRVPVGSEPEMRAHEIAEGVWLNEWVITLMDTQEVLRFSENAGRWHYLEGLISGGGTKPGTNDPDYRVWPYIAAHPREISPLTELLGLGPMYDFDKDEPIGDGRAPILHPKWPEENYHALDVQERVVTDMDGRPTYAKGVGQGVKPLALKNGLAQYEKMEGERREYYQGAAKIIRTALANDKPTVILARGDQIKVGGDRATTKGTCLLAGTFLRGTFDAHPSGRPRAQFPGVPGNQQLTQFLDHFGYEKLQQYAHWHISSIAEKFESIEGIAEIASRNTLSRVEEIKAGQGQWQGGQDLLTDAITGGGVRLDSSQDWIDQLEGDDGQVVMTAQVRKRLQGNAASYIGRAMESLGIDGRAHLHLGCVSDQTYLDYVWPRIGGKEYVERAEQEGPYFTPLSDPSAVAHPHKVSRLLGADDDGDIVAGIAAIVEVGGQRRKVVLNWRFPCVDVPALWALPADQYTPWDARTDEEEERYRRIIEVFGPSLKEGEPPIEDAEITLLKASSAYRLAGTGARDAIDAENISKEASEESAWEMVERKRKLNRAGPLTRDLERLGDMMAKAGERAATHKAHGQEKAYEATRSVFERIRDEAGATSVGTEIQLIKHKKEVGQDPVDPTVEWPQIGYPDGTAVRSSIMPIDYPSRLDSIDYLLKEDAEQGGGVCLEGWQGPRGESRHAQLMRELAQGPVQDVVEAFRDIKVDRGPFIQAFRKRKGDYIARFDPEEQDEVEDLLDQEAKGVQMICEFYRQAWRTVMNEIETLTSQPDDPERAAEQAEKRQQETAQALSRAMEELSQLFSPMGLAEGIARDWETTRLKTLNNDSTQTAEVPANTTGAGMRLLSGRHGEVLTPVSVETEPIEPGERQAIVYSTRSHGEMPGRLGQTLTVSKIRLGQEDGEGGGRGMAVMDVQRPSGQEAPQGQEQETTQQVAYFDSLSDAPDPGLEGALASGTMEVRLTRIAPKRAVLRWLSA